MTDAIKRLANELVERFLTRDPFELADALDIHVGYLKNPVRLKGMYCVVLGSRYVYLNPNLDYETTRVVLAHELGHDALHRPLAQSTLWREYSLYDMSARPEYEANVFAAYILLPEDEVMSLAMEGYDIAGIAAQMHTSIGLVTLKIAEMCKDGYSLKPPDVPKSDFLA